jgi:hypothetical protein
MAKKRSSRKKISTRPIVKQIDLHIKELRSVKSGATAKGKKEADRHIKKLHRLKMMAMDACEGFLMLVD